MLRYKFKHIKFIYFIFILILSYFIFSFQWLHRFTFNYATNHDVLPSIFSNLTSNVNMILTKILSSGECYFELIYIRACNTDLIYRASPDLIQSPLPETAKGRIRRKDTDIQSIQSVNFLEIQNLVSYWMDCACQILSCCLLCFLRSNFTISLICHCFAFL